MQTTLAQRFDSFQLHIEQRKDQLTPEENREFLRKAINHLQDLLMRANKTPSAKDFQDALNFLGALPYNQEIEEWLQRMKNRGLFPKPIGGFHSSYNVNNPYYPSPYSK